MKQASDEEDELRALLYRGKFEEAYKYARRFDENNPGFFLDLVDTYADCALLSGHYEEAYKDLRTALANDELRTEQRYARFSLALAMRGRVVKGQADYLEGLIKTHNPMGGPSGKAQTSYPATPHGVALMSTLALITTLGGEEGALYSELALKLQPDCAAAAFYALDFYHFRKRVGDATRIANQVLDALPESDVKTEFLYRANRYLPPNWRKSTKE